MSLQTETRTPNHPPTTTKDVFAGVCAGVTFVSSIALTIFALLTISFPIVGDTIPLKAILGTAISGGVMLASAIAQKALGNSKSCIAATALLPMGVIALLLSYAIL